MSDLDADAAADALLFGDLYDRAMHSREPNCWPESYRAAPYPLSKFAKAKVGQSAFIDVNYEESEERLKEIKKFHRWWRKQIGVEFLISMHETGYGARTKADGTPETCVIRIQRIK